MKIYKLQSERSAYVASIGNTEVVIKRDAYDGTWKIWNSGTIGIRWTLGAFATKKEAIEYFKKKMES